MSYIKLTVNWQHLSTKRCVDAQNKEESVRKIMATYSKLWKTASPRNILFIAMFPVVIL